MRLNTILMAVVFSVATVAGGPVRAQEADRDAMANEIVVLLRVEALLTDFFATMSPMVAASMAREMEFTPSQEARFGEIVAEEFAAASPGMSREVARIYATRMTDEQLSETVAFLRSPSGAAFLQTQVDAQGELERIGAAAGMQVGYQALMRFNAEQDRTKP